MTPGSLPVPAFLARLALTLLLGAAPVLAQGEVTPAQIEALKEQIEDIDDWLADAEDDRSDLEQQLTATERRISRLTRERRDLRQQGAKQQQRLEAEQASAMLWMTPTLVEQIWERP